MVWGGVKRTVEEGEGGKGKRGWRDGER